MAHSGTDPFTKLPAEIRLHVLSSIKCTSTISRLIQASPIMFEQYLADKKYIIRSILDFDQQTMQDTMAIVLFPRVWCPGKEEPNAQHSAPIREHLRLWSKGKLPNPFEINNDRLISQLYRLHRRIILLIEDYITKATASFPPREYLCLPQAKHLSDEEYLMFKGAKVAPRFHFANLTSLERKRFVNAFLMYELSCKINGIIHLPDDIPLRKVSRAEFEGVECIREYFRSLYGAMFAQCSNMQLPSNKTETSHVIGLQFPDTFYFDASSHAHKVGLFYHQLESEVPDYSAQFARLGLDSLADFLRYDLADADEIEGLRAHIRDSPSLVRQFWTWDTQFSLLFQYEPRYEGGCDSNMYKQLSLDTHSQLGYEIGRQRAWVLFDNNRHYPQDTAERPIFPSDSFIMVQSIEITFSEDWFRNPSRVRAWRRKKLSSEERIRTHLAKAGII